MSSSIILDVDVYTHIGMSFKGKYTSENRNYIWNKRNDYHIKVSPTIMKDYYIIIGTKMLIYREDFDINYITVENM